MGRRPRIVVAGGIYHVYNRVSRGEHVFRNDEEADRLEELLAITTKRDDFQILAWCVMSNHYHLAVRMGDVALSRSIRTIHQKFAQSFNGRHRVFGRFWQGRYRSKYVDDYMYLRQLVGRSTCGFCDGQIKGKGTIEQNINTPAPGTFMARLIEIRRGRWTVTSCSPPPVLRSTAPGVHYGERRSTPAVDTR